MSITETLKSASALLADIRREQRALLEAAASDGAGRTLGSAEAEAYELLARDAKALESEIALLTEQRDLDALTARPPPKEW